MKIIEVENNKYEIIKDYKNGFDEEEFINHYTDFFEDYDYIVGDIDCAVDCKYYILKKINL